jgi:hypothetical protein
MLLGAAAWNTSRALEVANASSRDAVPAECPRITPAVSAPPAPSFRQAHREIITADNHKLMEMSPDRTKCINGELFIKLKDEWRNNGPC